MACTDSSGLQPLQLGRIDPVPETTPVVTSWEDLYRTACELARIGPSKLERAVAQPPRDAVGGAAVPTVAPAPPDPAEGSLEPDADERLEPAGEAPPVVYQERYQARSRAGEPPSRASCAVPRRPSARCSRPSRSTRWRWRSTP